MKKINQIYQSKNIYLFESEGKAIICTSEDEQITVPDNVVFTVDFGNKGKGKWKTDKGKWIPYKETANRILCGLIYKAKDRTGKFNCYSPAVNGDKEMYIVDCWIVDESGNISKETDVSPIPVKTENLGDVVGIKYF